MNPNQYYIYIYIMGWYAYNEYRTIQKSGQANSTLAQAKRVRFSLETELDNGTPDCSLNIDFVKSMTGADEISAWELYAKKSTYNSFFVYYCNVSKTRVK